MDERTVKGRLGDRAVARIGFGAMQLERADGMGGSLAVLRRAVELGVDHIDTADFYGDGVVNDLIRSALHPYPADLALVSKVGAEHSGGGLVPAQRPGQLRAGVEANLRRLDVDRLAVVNLRRVDGGAGIRAEGDQVVDLDSQLAELSALRAEGKIGAIGLSNVDRAQLRQALPAGVACVQNLYNLLDRSAEPLARDCLEAGVAWVPFFPLGSGFPSQRRVDADPTVVAVAAATGATPAQVGLAWLLAHAPHVLPIPGTASIAHLEENVAAAGVTLDADAMATLDALGAP